MKRKIFLFLFILLFSGCSSTKTKYVFTSIFGPLPCKYIVLSDNYKSIYYEHIVGDSKKIDTILFYICGSGRESLQYYLKEYFKGLDGNVKIYALQKRYISNRSTGLFKPGKEYRINNTLAQRIRDNSEFINFILKSEAIKDKRIVIFGVSEGGTIAPEIAYNTPECTHLAVLGEGGMKGIDSFRIWGRQNGIDFDKKYKLMKKEPHKSIECKWWLSALDYDPMNYLKQMDISMFYGMGAKDHNVPVESLHYLRDTFDNYGKRNLEIKFYPDCNHFLMDSEGKSHIKDYMRDISLWWQRNSRSCN